MINELIFQKTLNAIRLCKNKAWGDIDLPLNELSSLTSTMICNVFGGEILKKRHNDGWHFYNQIEGERFDFMAEEIDNTSEIINIQDLPALPEETHEYFEQEDYLAFYMEFILTFEEEVGLEYKPPPVSRIKLHLEN
jgi:hypothetical protein